MPIYQADRSDGTMAQFTRVGPALNWGLNFVRGEQLAPYEIRIRDDVSVTFTADGRWAHIQRHDTEGSACLQPLATRADLNIAS